MKLPARSHRKKILKTEFDALLGTDQEYQIQDENSFSFGFVDLPGNQESESKRKHKKETKVVLKIKNFPLMINHI